MKKVLLINGSFRRANSKFLLDKISENLGEDFEINEINLRDKNIKFCSGCMTCHKSSKCVYNDDMMGILDDIKNSDLIILACPNYFGNINAMTKNFIDRTCPFHEEKLMANKPFVFVYTGDYKPERTLKQLSVALDGFKFNHKIKNVAEVAVQTNGIKSFADIEEVEHTIRLVIKRINEYFCK